MAEGILVTLATGTHQQKLVGSGNVEYASCRLLNPNDGILYAARNRDIPDLSAPNWDWKIPSQSYASVPGPFQTIGLYYVDQSGAGVNGEVTFYPSQTKVDDPLFIAVGRAIQRAGSAMDIITGVQPGNPPAGSSRLWIDADNNLHVLSASGVDQYEVDTNDVLGGVLTGSLWNPGMAAGAAAANVGGLGGSLSGSLPNPGIATGVITSAQIADGSIATVDIGLQQITQALLASGAVGNPQMAAGAAAANVGPLGGALTGSNLPNPVLPVSANNTGNGIALTAATWTTAIGLVLGPGNFLLFAFVQFINCPNNAGVEIRITDGGTVWGSGSLTIPATAAYHPRVGCVAYVTPASSTTYNLQGYCSGAGSTMYHITGGTGQARATELIALRVG